MTEIEFIERFLKENVGYVREKYSGKNALTVTEKDDANDLLTEVDLTIQKRAVEQVRQHFPGDILVGEEGQHARFPDDPDGRAWVIDPIDGTYNFVRGLFPVFGISLAFAQGGVPVAGGVMLPIAGNLFLAERGGGSYLNGCALQVSDVKTVAEACVDVDFCGLEDRRRLLESASDAVCSVGQMRVHGSAVASICQIASADTEGYLHMSLHPWDYAAGQVIVEEAGGISSRLDGSPLKLFDRREGVLITNGAIHEEMLALIRA